MIRPEPPPGVSERWVSVTEVAQHLGVTRESIYRWVERRGLPGHKLGKLWKFRLSEVDHWVEAAGAEGTAELEP